MSGRIASAPCVFDTAIRVTASGGRAARAAALAMPARTDASRSSADAPFMRAAIETGMGPRHPLPRVWLMTDERQGEGLWRALDLLPAGAGVVFRHHSLPARQRGALFEQVRQHARARGLVLVSAGRLLPGA